MTTHHDLWIASRARMQLLEHELAELHTAAILHRELAARRKTAAPVLNQAMAETRRAPIQGPGFLAANVLHRISALLLSIGRDLDCYADRMLARARPERWDDSLSTPC